MGFNITIIHKKGIIERVMKKTIMRKFFITSKMQPGGLHFFVISQRPGKITVISIDSSYGFSISAVQQNRLVSLKKHRCKGNRVIIITRIYTSVIRAVYVRLLQALRHGQVIPVSERRDAGCTNVFYKKRRDNG